MDNPYNSNNRKHPEAASLIRTLEETRSYLSSHVSCEFTPGLTAMIQYPQIVLFPCVLSLDLTDQLQKSVFQIPSL